MLERADDVGGVWRDNIYPGCRCDVPSLLYSFSFAQKPDWTTHYAGAAEIWQYLRDCVQNFGLEGHLLTGHDVTDASWDDASGTWNVTSTGGDFRARMLIIAVGALNEPTIPAIAGLSDFDGELFHSGQWPSDFDPAGKRIAVIGTGASAIQIVPEIAPAAAALAVYQRTPPWIMPRGDKPMGSRARALFEAIPATRQAARDWQFLTKEVTTTQFVKSGRLLEFVGKISSKHLAAQIPDPALREQLTAHYTPGCKRLLLSDDWYPALARDNVTVVSEPIERITAAGIVDSADPGKTREFDAIVLATGFQVTANSFFARVRARGSSIAQDWLATRPSAYLGSTVHGYPNLIVMTGPNTGLGSSSMVLMIEAQAAYAASMAAYLHTHPRTSLDVRPEVVDAYLRDLDARLANSVWETGGCSSWYRDAKGRITTMWPGTTTRFRKLTRQINLDDYALLTAE